MKLPLKAAFGRFFEKNPALRIAEFRYFLSIRFGLIFALNLQSTIIYYWVYHITNDKLSLGLVGLAEVIPAVCFSLFSGHVVDLNEKRKMVLLCLIGYIFLAVGLAILTLESAAHALSLSTVLNCVYGLVFIGGAIRAFYGPSGFALSGLVVPRELYPNATSWSSMAWQMGAVIGPLIGGFLIAWSIAYGMFTIIGILLLLLIPVLNIKPKPVIILEKEPVLTSLTKGIKFVAKTPALLGAQCLDMFSVLFGGAVALL
ncbi:MAG: MFS transporter, partial [Chitinophagaceae bacterium]